MKYFYFYVFFLIFFIFAITYLNIRFNNKWKESFHSGKQTFILLGDSILNNNLYVSDGKSVENLLYDKTNGNTICLAKDNTKINHIYTQIDSIPIHCNHPLTTIFLSIGGNDILSNINISSERKEDENKDFTKILNNIFKSYKELIEGIQSQFPNANLILLDIYYPIDLKYTPFHPIIKEWNEKLYNFALESKTPRVEVLKLSNIFTKPEDFSHGMEPSSIGGQKLVNSIFTSY